MLLKNLLRLFKPILASVSLGVMLLMFQNCSQVSFETATKMRKSAGAVDSPDGDSPDGDSVDGRIQQPDQVSGDIVSGPDCKGVSAKDLIITSIPGGWVVGPKDKSQRSVYVEVVDRKDAQLTQFYNRKGHFGLPVGSTIQASSSLPVGERVRVNVSGGYDFNAFKLIDPCPVDLTLQSPASPVDSYLGLLPGGPTFCRDSDSTWHGSLQQQQGTHASSGEAIDYLMEELQRCSDSLTTELGLSRNVVGNELFRDSAGLTRIGFQVNRPLGGIASPSSISSELPSELAGRLRECAAAINLELEDLLTGFKPCQCN